MNNLELVLLVQSIVVSFILAVIAYRVTGGDGPQPRKWARVRIPVSEKRRRNRSDVREEEEYETWPTLQWLFLGVILLLLLLTILGLNAG